MKLVICDDNLKDLNELESLLIKYENHQSEICFEIERFSDSSTLLHKSQHNEAADIYILDVIMSQITGIDLENEIRKNNALSTIIYVTTSDVFAMDAYNIHTLRYLLKPIKENNFNEALDHTLSHMNARSDSVYAVKTKNRAGIYPIFPNRIYRKYFPETEHLFDKRGNSNKHLYSEIL